MKKTLALTLALIMVLCMLPSVAFAQTWEVANENSPYCTLSYTKKEKWELFSERNATVKIYVNYKNVETVQLKDVTVSIANLKVEAKAGYYYGNAANNTDCENGTYNKNTKTLTFVHGKDPIVHIYLFTFEKGVNVDFTRYLNNGVIGLDKACDTLKISYTHDGVKYEYDYTKWDQTHTTYVPHATNIYVTPEIKEGYEFKLWLAGDSWGDGANVLYSIKNDKLIEETPTIDLGWLGKFKDRVRQGSFATTQNMAFKIGSGYNRIEIALFMKTGSDNPEYEHALFYDANGGTGAPGTETSGKTTNTSYTFTVSNTVPTRVNYTFLGWADKKDATEVQYTAGNTITVSGEKTIYAVWKSSINPPTHEELKGLVGKVAVNCIIGMEHGKEEYDLIEGSYISGTIETDSDGNYTYSITINPKSYVDDYKAAKGEHTLVPADQEKTVSFTRGKEDTGWKVVENQATVPVVFTVKHATTVPGSVSEVTKTRLKEVPKGVSLPENVTINKEETVIFTDNNTSATLLYAFTVTGTPSAEVVIKDDHATFIIGNGQTVNDEITVTLPAAGGNETKTSTTVHGYRTFSVDDIKDGKLVNNATANVTNGDPNNDKTDTEDVPALDNRTLDNTLTVKKLVSGNAANMEEKFPFKATFTFPVPGASATPDGVTSGESVEIDFELAHSQTKTFSYTSDQKLQTMIDGLLRNRTVDGTGDNVFAMLSYKVEETNAKGYTLATSGDAEGYAEGHNTVTFTNTKNKPNDDHGGHYHTTTTPVPVIVIPPKTGDMTVWQSILHFLGIR